MTKLDIDADITKLLSLEHGRLWAAGMLICDFDLLIDTTALHHNLTLLTNTRSHLSE